MGLDELRREIDEADADIIRALIRRAEAARKIGEHKTSAGDPFFAPDREASIFRHLDIIDATPLPSGALRSIFVEIISACLALERALRVAFLGPEFTFSHQAVLARFGKACQPVPRSSVHDAISAVQTQQADVALVPVENSTEGPVGETFDCLVEADLQVVGEFYLAINHCLVGHGSMDQVRVIYSHPQPLAQCRRWLSANCPNAELIPAPSSAAAAAQASGTDGAAAVAPEAAGRAHNLEVLADHIQDDPTNRTRFWIVGAAMPSATGRDKTSLAMATPHRAGALHEALQPFRDFGINMTMIHSRPLPGRKWEYLFFIDFQGHMSDPGPARALAALRDLCPMLKVLGSYPEAD